MAQHAIAVSDKVYEMMNTFRGKMHAKSRPYSASRCIDYLIEFEKTITDEAFKVSTIQDLEEQAKAWIALVSKALNYNPEAVRKPYRRMNHVDLELRASVRSQLVERLGMEHPSSELINWFIENGNDNMLSKLALMKNEGKLLDFLSGFGKDEAP